MTGIGSWEEMQRSSLAAVPQIETDVFLRGLEVN